METRGCAVVRGFTLIELMIAVAVLGLLLALAYPSYLDQLRKSRRADAFNALQTVQQAQERWRANRPAFAGGAQLTAAVNPPNPADAGLGLSDRSPSGHYDIAIAAANATGYEVTATARSGSSQAADGACARLAVRMLNGNIGYGSGSSEAIDWNDTASCWPR
jgi:type IV pilus assembly protein PilE